MLLGLRDRFVFLFKGPEASEFYDQLIVEQGFGGEKEFGSGPRMASSVRGGVTKGGGMFKFSKKGKNVTGF
jgi:hypothetical protein